MSRASGLRAASSKAVAASVQKSQPPNFAMRTGIVISIESPSTLTVDISGSTIPNMPYLSSYSPLPGDNVQILKMDNTWIVIGSVGMATHHAMFGEAGEVNIAAFGATTVFTQTVPFAFPFSIRPVVMVNIDSAATETNLFWAKAATITTIDFSLRLTCATATAFTATRTIQWLAIEQG